MDMTSALRLLYIYADLIELNGKGRFYGDLWGLVNIFIYIYIYIYIKEEAESIVMFPSHKSLGTKICWSDL